MRVAKEYLNSLIDNGRSMLKPDWSLFNNSTTDEEKGVKLPELVKENDKVQDNIIITLITSGMNDISKKTLSECIANRKSTREFSEKQLTIHELSYLIWETSRIKEYGEGWSTRAIPSAGAKHCLETYIYIDRVENTLEGLYHYLPMEGTI